MRQLLYDAAVLTDFPPPLPWEGKTALGANCLMLSPGGARGVEKAELEGMLIRIFTLDPQFESARFPTHLEDLGASKVLVGAVVARFKALNAKIAADTANLGPGFCIGHSFFCPASRQITLDEAWYRRVVQNEVAPLLRYWFDKPKHAQEAIDRLLDKL